MRLLRLSAEMESRAASLRVEALQCMTIALAGTDTKHFWDTMTTFFGAASDKEDVWDFIDPVSRVARPLDLESTDDDEEEDADTEATASTSSSTQAQAAARPPIARSAKVVRSDVCPMDEAIQVFPQNEKTVQSTGIPHHLLGVREPKTSGRSGSSLYHCRHPACEPTFIAKGGTAPLYSHIRRHHLGIVLVCPYCPARLYYTGDGWLAHMEKQHPKAVWYREQVQVPEAIEAAALLQQVTTDPTSLGKSAHRMDRVLLDSMPLKEEETGIKVKAEVVDVQMEEQEGDQLFQEEAVGDEPGEERAIFSSLAEGHQSFPVPPSERLSQRPSMEVVYDQPTSASVSGPPSKKPHKE